MVDVKRINLALQGGGAHGAFTWGVLDRLLADERVKIAAISGTSAGAMNAAAVADGLTTGGGGREVARARLAEFWRSIGSLAALGPWLRGPLDMASGTWNLDSSPVFQAADIAMRLLSPYHVNPLNVNPVLSVLEQHVDFERVRRCDKLDLFVSATNVRTGRIRVFHRDELTARAVMASAALPQVYQAVEIDGEAYWDGGFLGNPAIFPLIYETDCPDVVIVQINPVEREDVPRSPDDIRDRVNEISFNATLLRELRTIAYLTDLIDSGELDPARFKRVFLHRIPPAEEMLRYGSSSKFNAERAFLEHLKTLGQGAADAWLAGQFADVGVRSTLHLDL